MGDAAAFSRSETLFDSYVAHLTEIYSNLLTQIGGTYANQYALIRLVDFETAYSQYAVQILIRSPEYNNGAQILSESLDLAICNQLFSEIPHG